MELGTQTHFRQGWNIALLDDLQRLGINSIRDSITWPKAEATKGVYDFSHFSAAWVNQALDAGMNVLLVFDTRNALYDNGFSVYSPEGVQAYADFIVATLQAFPGVGAIELGNEYNGDNFVTGPIAEAPKSERDNFYKQLVVAVHQALDAADIDVTVIGASTHSIPVDYFAALEANGALDLVDGVSIHPYTTDPEQFADQLALLRDVIGDEIEIHATEFSTDFARPEDASAYLAKMVSVMAAGGVDSASWYAFAKQSAYPNNELFNQNTDKVTLAGYTFGLLDDMLEGGTQVEQVAVDAYTYFYKFGDNEAIIWGEARSVALAAGVESFDIAGNRITNFTMLSADMPVLLRSADGIDLDSLVFGSNYLLADTYHDFDLTNDTGTANGFEGPWSYFAQNGRGQAWALETKGGDITSGQVWTPYLGLDWLRPFRVTATDVVPVDFNTDTNPSHEYSIVERYTAAEDGVVTIRGSWDVANNTTDGVRLVIEVNDQAIFTKNIFNVANGHVFDLELTGIVLNAGDKVDFVIGSRSSPTGDTTQRRVQILEEGAPPAAASGGATPYDPVVPAPAPPANPFDFSTSQTAVSIIGTAGAETIIGGSGNDVLTGAGGKDTIYGGAGDDTIVTDGKVLKIDGGAGYDTVTFSGFHPMVFDLVAAKVEKVNGSAGNETLDASTANYAVAIMGNNGLDILRGGSAGDFLSGGKGDDQLYGGAGDDTLDGGAVNDIIEGGAGNDLMTGGQGNDIFRFGDNFGNDTITDFGGKDKIDLSMMHGITGLSDIGITYYANYTMITIGDDTIKLQGVKQGIDAGDFIF
jgi:Ca2+-binding RTX toxin-like protein